MDNKEIDLRMQIINKKQQIKEIKARKFLNKERAFEVLKENKPFIFGYLGGKIIFRTPFNITSIISLLSFLVILDTVLYIANWLLEKNREKKSKSIPILESGIEKLEKELYDYQITKGMENAIDIEYVEVKDYEEQISELEDYREVLVSMHEDIIIEDSMEAQESKNFSNKPNNRFRK